MADPCAHQLRLLGITQHDMAQADLVAAVLRACAAKDRGAPACARRNCGGATCVCPSCGKPPRVKPYLMVHRASQALWNTVFGDWGPAGAAVASAAGGEGVGECGGEPGTVPSGAGGHALGRQAASLQQAPML